MYTASFNSVRSFSSLTSAFSSVWASNSVALSDAAHPYFAYHAPDFVLTRCVCGLYGAPFPSHYSLLRFSVGLRAARATLSPTLAQRTASSALCAREWRQQEGVHPSSASEREAREGPCMLDTLCPCGNLPTLRTAGGTEARTPKAADQRFGRRGRCRPLPPRLALLLLTVALGPGQAAIRIPAGFKQPPEITVQPVSVTAFTADDISLTCEASGNPAPSFRWVKDGEEFDPTSDPQLSTSADSGSFSASGNDPIGEYQGKYSCYAYNGLGTAVSNEVQIIIENTPKYVKEKKVTRKVEEGESVVLKCNPPSSTVAPFIHWMDRSESLAGRRSPGRLLEASLSLSDRHVSRRITDFLCLRFSARFRVSVVKSNCERATLYLSWSKVLCESGSSAEYMFISPRSERVTQGRDGNLYFANVFASDGRDDYTCHAQYISARTILPKEPISLTVTTSNSVLRNRRPQMMHPSGAHSSYLALRGSTLELECIPEGLPTPTIQWVRRDGVLSESRTSRQNFERVLRFTNISETDSGEYQCMASNSQGVVVHTYTVTVEAAPYWTKSPESQLYAPGETVRLDCQADGIPTPTITWSLNGSPISSVDPDPRRRAEGGTMVMEDVQPGDTAVYQCLASNKHGTALFNTYVYIIELPPQMLTEDAKVYTVVEGQRALLSCETFGSPKPKITWEGESSDTLLSDPRVSQLANGTLQIASIAQEDAGLYTCSVPGANLSITAELDVLNKTAIISPPEYLRVQRGKSGFFTCQAVVDPKLYPPVIQWRMNRKKIFESPYNDKYTLDGSTLAVSDVQSEDEGMYTCEVITRLDMAHASGYITIIDKPDPPTLLQLSAPKDRSLMLSWSPEDDHNSPILEFVVEYEEQQFGKGEWIEVARVTGEVNHVTAPLRPFGTYSFRVTAINELGKSKPSSPSALHSTPPAAPDMNPEDVRSESTEPGTLVIMWEEMDQQNFNGPGFQYKVMWRQSIGQGPQWHHNYTSSPPFIVMEAGTFIPFEIKVQAVNDLGEGPEPEPEIGYSGEDTPLEAPVGVGVEVINSTAIKVKWAPVSKDTVRGHLLGYKVHLKRLGPGNRRGRRKRGRNEREGERSDSVTVETGANEEKKVLGGLQPYSRYAVMAESVRCGKVLRVPDRWVPLPAVPSHPTSLHLESPSETELTLHWTPPSQPNGVLTGYLLQYQQITDSEDSPMQVETIDDSSASQFTVKQLDPQSRYRFYLRGRTSAGDGEAIIKEGATMLDGAPPSNISMSVGETSVNLSWVSGDRHRNVAFHIHYLSKNGGGQWKVSEKLNSTQSFYQLQGLQPGSQYRLQFIFSNNTFWETDIQTQGEGNGYFLHPSSGLCGMLELKEGFATQGWFIGLISAIMVLLLVLLILCIIKRTKGGKYSVKDKEEGQVDSEARPMKDEAFGEYSDNEEKGTTSQPSLCEDSKLGSQGSLARLAEAVDGNQDSLLVVQLDGKMDIPGPGDQEALAATSPVNPSADPPGNPTTPNSITGILD
ncbi:neural cell adhesion molecule L1-like [Scleropages formosus]|uniref:Neural cell adhesion molecule L1-like n=1 Tax=Scleropages formosus TaxID=113540 RepID=A0A0P7U493_SCLFO|nr:neural cell adhesion molecule L1-like [Scleropages formosus]